MAETVTVVAEPTPNPNSIKFTVNRQVTSGGGQSFAGADEAIISPLARRLFAIEGVRTVFFLKDFISVGRTSGADWQVLVPQVEAAIRAYYEAHE